MACDLCKDVVERKDVPHTIKTCKGCGRELHVVELGDHGRGIKVEKGDRFTIPSEWLRLSLNPLESKGTFSRYGLQWFAEQIFVRDLFKKESEFETELEAMEQYADTILQNSELISGLDLTNPEHAEPIFAAIKNEKATAEWWAMWTGLFLAASKDALAQGRHNRAMWALACAERCRAMLVYKEHLEEVVWMGHSAKRIVDILAVWDGNRHNADEQFWQLTFNENSYVLSQVFAVPVVFVQEKAYVGGMRMDRTEARFVDYLFSAESSQEAILIEIKTPVTKIIGSKYRGGVFAPSSELSGAVVQLLRYRTELVRNLRTLAEKAKHPVSAFSPKCVLLVGNAAEQLNDADKRDSFEHYRAGLRDVEIVTYDELFRKVEVLAALFNLVKSKKKEQ